MSWTSIVTALVLAIVSAWLVASKGWEPREAFLAVGLVAILACVLLLSLLLVAAGKGQRTEVLEAFVTAMKSNLRALLDSFRGRR